MKTRTITRRLREQAAHICEVEASTPDLCGDSLQTARELGFPDDAGRIAMDAWCAAERSCDYAPDYAEAALLLREGFTPEGWIAVIG